MVTTTERYKVENIVLSSHVVAFAVFNLLKTRNPDLDLYELLRLPLEDFVITREKVEEAVSELQSYLIGMENEGKLKLSEEVRGDVSLLVEDGVNNLGSYHVEQPLKFDKRILEWSSMTPYSIA